MVVEPSLQQRLELADQIELFDESSAKVWLSFLNADSHAFVSPHVTFFEELNLLFHNTSMKKVVGTAALAEFWQALSRRPFTYSELRRLSSSLGGYSDVIKFLTENYFILPEDSAKAKKILPQTFLEQQPDLKETAANRHLSCGSEFVLMAACGAFLPFCDFYFKPSGPSETFSFSSLLSELKSNENYQSLVVSLDACPQPCDGVAMRDIRELVTSRSGRIIFIVRAGVLSGLGSILETLNPSEIIVFVDDDDFLPELVLYRNKMPESAFIPVFELSDFWISHLPHIIEKSPELLGDAVRLQLPQIFENPEQLADDYYNIFSMLRQEHIRELVWGQKIFCLTREEFIGNLCNLNRHSIFIKACGNNHSCPFLIGDSEEFYGKKECFLCPAYGICVKCRAKNENEPDIKVCRFINKLVFNVLADIAERNRQL